MFTFFKELWLLIKMLFSSKPSDFNELTYIPTKCFPAKGYSYLTWCGACLYRESNKMLQKPTNVTINHENIHLAQAKDYKTWVRYYLAYFWNWIKTFPPFSKKAYYFNKFEIEAYAKENNFNYLNSRKLKAADDFNFSGKSKAWEESNKNPVRFKTYLKTKFN